MANERRFKPGESFSDYFERRKARATEASSTLQRRRLMSRDEKRLGAVESMARKLKDGAEKAGREVSYDAARTEAARIAERTFRKHDN